MDLALVSSENKNWLKTFGIYQIIGGLIGIVVMIPYYRFSGHIANIILSVLAITLFLFSIYTGWTLFKLRFKGIKLTILNQLLQTFSVAVSTFYFSYISGLSFAFNIDVAGSLLFGFKLNTSTFSFNFSGGDKQTYFSINILAILISVKTEKIGEQLKKLKQMPPDAKTQ